jgi:hypothetical protein
MFIHNGLDLSADLLPTTATTAQLTDIIENSSVTYVKSCHARKPGRLKVNNFHKTYIK